MHRLIWEYVLVLLLLVTSGFLGACAAPEEPQEQQATADTSHSSERPTAISDGRTVKQRLQDATIAAEVQKALLDTMSLRRFDFEITATQGRVALRGSVGTDAERILAANIARDVKGVKDILNQIALFPADSTAVAADSTSKDAL